MKVTVRPQRIRTIALLLTGVLPLAAQPAALAGQLAMSRYVDRMVGDLPGKLSIDDLLRLLDESSDADGRDADALGRDMISVLIQCRLLSLFSDTALLQAPDLDSKPVAMGPLSIVHSVSVQTVAVDQAEYPVTTERPSRRRLSDEQPLGP
ncbi:MAG: hypothetical protein WBW88_15615 [Rhodothermales bacterium]